MSIAAERKYRKKSISPTKVILSAFALIILFGAILLMLPVSTAERGHADFLTALFTATSATCVTGLSVVDTASYWSTFGQTVILILIQCGGLGFMTFATVFSLMIHRRISVSERIVMSQAISIDSLSGIVGLTKRIVLITAIAEGIGAALLAIRFIPEFGFGNGLFRSIFHAVSSFCNAGFDIMGIKNGSAGSMSEYAEDPIVSLTLVALMVFGGLGFFVWEDIRRKKRFGALSLHSKLVLTATVWLLALGTAGFLIFEFSNPGTIGEMSLTSKLCASLFQSATCRTAGFYTIPQGDMTISSRLLSIALMFIGGSPGSTAGGVKTTTVAVLILTSLCVMKGKNETEAFSRKISYDTIYKCVALFFCGIVLSAAGTFLLERVDGVNAIDAMFECVSAISTTGLSVGITTSLSDASKIILIVFMYFGRVGLLTVSLGILGREKKRKISYPEGKILIG